MTNSKVGILGLRYLVCSCVVVLSPHVTHSTSPAQSQCYIITVKDAKTGQSSSVPKSRPRPFKYVWSSDRATVKNGAPARSLSTVQWKYSRQMQDNATTVFNRVQLCSAVFRLSIFVVVNKSTPVIC